VGTWQQRSKQFLLTDGGLVAVFVPLLVLTMAVAKLFEISGQASTWYPPAGVTLAALRLSRRSARWQVALVGLVVRIGFGFLVYGSSLGYEVAHSTAIIGVFFATSLLIDQVDVSQGDVLQLGRLILFGGIVAPLAASGAGVLVNLVFSRSTTFAAFRTFAVGDAIGIATVFPLLALAYRQLRDGPAVGRDASVRIPHVTELAVQAVALIVMPTLAMAVGRDSHTAFWALGMLPVLWVAVRRSMIAAAAAVVVGNCVLSAAGRIWLGPDLSLVDAQVVLFATTLAAGYISIVVRLQQRRLEERFERERLAANVARTDQLTGLPNRAGLLERLRVDSDIPQQTGGQRLGVQQPLGVIVMDIERFAEVIDGLGAATGDAVLVSVGTRLQAVVDGVGVVGRLEGDSFAIALPTSDSAVALRVAEEALSAISAQPYSEGLGLYLTARAGVAVESSAASADEVLRNGGIALHTAKVGRQRRPVLFSQAQRTGALENRTLLSALRYAIDHAPEQIGLAYQPIFGTADRSLLGAEALLRWQHPGLGLVSPVRFIPLAERSGLMLELGDLVMRKAVQQLGQWTGLLANRDFHLHVNVSPTQLADDDLPARFLAICRVTGVAPARVTLELTESALGLDPEASMAMLERLRSSGARICLDDFGTGFSTIGWLSRFPIDELKIDQSFVAGLPAKADDVAIAKLILGLARELSLDVTAEGVEHPQQLAALQELGCERVQGYLLSRPISSVKMEELLVAHKVEA
jgi:diguanylate cyclase (GGDEF)-like protein